MKIAHHPLFPVVVRDLRISTTYLRREIREDERRGVDEREEEAWRERVEAAGRRGEREIDREETERFPSEDRFFTEDGRLTTPRLDRRAGLSFPLNEGFEVVAEGVGPGRDLPRPLIDRRFEEDTRFSERIEEALFRRLPDRRREDPDTRALELPDTDGERDIRAG